MPQRITHRSDADAKRWLLPEEVEREFPKCNFNYHNLHKWAESCSALGRSLKTRIFHVRQTFSSVHGPKRRLWPRKHFKRADLETLSRIPVLANGRIEDDLATRLIGETVAKLLGVSSGAVENWKQRCVWIDKPLDSTLLIARVGHRFQEIRTYRLEDVKAIDAAMRAEGLTDKQAEAEFGFKIGKLNKLVRDGKIGFVRTLRRGKGKRKTYPGRLFVRAELARQFEIESADVPAQLIRIDDAAREYKIKKTTLESWHRRFCPWLGRKLRGETRVTRQPGLASLYALYLDRKDVDDAMRAKRADDTENAEWVSALEGPQSFPEFGVGYRGFYNWFKAGSHPNGQAIARRMKRRPGKRDSYEGKRVDVAAALKQVLLARLGDPEADRLTESQLSRRYGVPKSTVSKIVKVNKLPRLDAKQADEKGVVREVVLVERKAFEAAIGQGDAISIEPPASEELANPNDGRDRWIYEQRISGVNWKTIRQGVNGQADSEGWEKLNTLQACMLAVGRYCKRNNLPRPKRGKSGRPKNVTPLKSKKM